MSERITVFEGGRSLATLARRAAALDPSALARWQAVGEGALDFFVTTPFDCLAARRVRGTAENDKAVAPAAELAAALTRGAGAETTPGHGDERSHGPGAETTRGHGVVTSHGPGAERSRGHGDPSPVGEVSVAAAVGGAAAWPGALPPASGFVARDEVPVGVASRLADEGRSLARQFSGPAGPPRSLLDAVVLTADAESLQPVEIPMRMIFACTSLGLIPGFDAPAGIPRHLRVATCGGWVRLDAPFGSVYRTSGLNLLV